MGSTVRRIYLLAVVLVSGFMILMFFAEGCDGMVNLVFGVNEQTGETHLTNIAGPLLATVPIIGLWLLHRRWLYAESSNTGEPIQPITIDRLFTYTKAFLGLLMASTGFATLLGELVQTFSVDNDWREDSGWPLGLLIGGAGVWVLAWQSTRGRLVRDTEAEQISTSRRAYLLIVLGGATIGLVVGLAMTIYQVMQKVLGVSSSSDLASDISLPLGVALTTVAILVYHGLLLRSDLRVHTAREGAGDRVRQMLVLTGPADADLKTVLKTLREHVPEEFEIDLKVR